jgi:hypothetical protein
MKKNKINWLPIIIIGILICGIAISFFAINFTGHAIDRNGKETNCLSYEELRTEQEACKTCISCYGKPVLSNVPEDLGCAIDVECRDATK